MSKNRKLLLKVTTLLMACAIIIPNNGSGWMVGEPELPTKLRKDDTIVD